MMNKQHLLCFSLVSLLVGSAHGVGGGNEANAASPLEALLLLGGGAAVLTAGNFSAESLKGMLEDIKAGKKNHTTLGADVSNCVKVTTILVGLLGFMGTLRKNKNTMSYMGKTTGSMVIASSVFLGLKHALNNPSLRLREVMGALALAGGARAALTNMSEDAAWTLG